MSNVEEFTSFVKERCFAAQDLEKIAEVIEPVKELDGSSGYRLKHPRGGDTISRERIIQRCKMLMYYTWHSRDYVKNILVENDKTDVVESGKLINEYIRSSRDLQISSYLANEDKHAGINHSQKWATELAPRYGDIYVRGIMESFPHRLKPVLEFTSKSQPTFELVGSVQVGNQKYPFTDFIWTVSCLIEDKDGLPLGNADGICERAFQTWFQVLADKEIDVEGPVDPRLSPHNGTLEQITKMRARSYRRQTVEMRRFHALASVATCTDKGNLLYTLSALARNNDPDLGHRDIARTCG